MNPIISETVTKIQEHAQACRETVKQPAIAAPPALSQNPFIQIQKELRNQHPELSENEIIIKSMNYLKEQFLQTVPPEDDISMKSGTSQPSSEPDVDPAEHVLAGESQLPEEDDIDSNFGDFWDSLTDVLTEKLAKSRKGKRHD